MTELEKFADALPQMQIIGDFLDWCEEQKREIAEPTPGGYHLMPINETRSAMLARYLGFDPVKLEDERRELLLKHSAIVGKAHGGDSRGT